MEFILVLFVLFIWFDLFQPIEIKRTFRVNALPDGKDLSGFNRYKSTATEWALVLIVFVKTLIRGKRRSTDFAQILAFGTVVAIEVFSRSSTARTACISWDVVLAFMPDRLQLTAVVAALVFTTKMFPVLVDDWNYLRKLISLKFLVLWRP